MKTCEWLNRLKPFIFFLGHGCLCASMFGSNLNDKMLFMPPNLINRKIGTLHIANGIVQVLYHHLWCVFTIDEARPQKIHSFRVRFSINKQLLSSHLLFSKSQAAIYGTFLFFNSLFDGTIWGSFIVRPFYKSASLAAMKVLDNFKDLKSVPSNKRCPSFAKINYVKLPCSTVKYRA